MNRFNAVMDWLEESASGLIRVAYLLAGVLAVASYFGDGAVPREVVSVSNAVLPWVLATALEVHTYLTARRVRSAWQGIQSASRGTEEHQKAVGSIRVNLGILAGLLGFSIMNQWQFLGQTWTPPTGAFALPLWAAYALRATIVPAAFLAAAFLVPVGESLAIRIKAEAHHYAGEVFGVARRQWKQQLRKMQSENRDVTGALVQLIEDESERHAIEVVHRAMFSVSAQAPTAGDAGLAAPAASEVQRAQTVTTEGNHPNGRGPKPKPQRKAEPVLKLVGPRVRTAEQRVKSVLSQKPDVRVKELARRARVSPSTAAKHRRLWLAEHEDIAS